MAIYHLSIKITSRGKGKSAVAAAAYRAGEKITNEYDGVTHDYTKKKGIVHAEILLPNHAPAEFSQRAVLWNSVEKCERYRTAQLAREIEIALPVELTQEQNISLVREFVNKTFVEHGMCADIVIHNPDTEDEDGNKVINNNPHAHIMLTMRPIDKDGTWGQKSYTVDNRKVPTVDWNDRNKAEDWRAAWAEITNEHLEKYGITEQDGTAITIDHRSFERQGITDRIPSIHLGVAAHQMEKRGIRTERGNINREIEVSNNLLRQLKARINKLHDWIKDEYNYDEPPTLADVISEILNQREQSGQHGRYGTINSLKAAANLLNFLTENNITDMSDLEKKVIAMYGKHSDIGGKLKSVDRRIKTLEEHLRHSGNFKGYRGHKAQYKKLYAEYQSLKKSKGLFADRKAQKALDTANEYHETHRTEISMYENAERYLLDVLQERFDINKLPPISKWSEELKTKTVERQSLTHEYALLIKEVDEVYKIQRNVRDILEDERQRVHFNQKRGRNDER